MNGSEGLHWFLVLLLALYLVHCEPFEMKPWYWPLVMAEMPPLIFAPHDGIICHNPMGDVPPIKFLQLTMVAKSKHCGYFDLWLWPAPHCLLDGQGNGWQKFPWQVIYSSYIHKARSATGYFGVLAQSTWDGQGGIARYTYRLAGIAYPKLA